ncbi:MAG TPA: DUF1080 domain-containing protein [Planctomycetaceae bacterium]|nr:DUF1080 domain-containing protein [Planctomycetaceae bacterium]
MRHIPRSSLRVWFLGVAAAVVMGAAPSVKAVRAADGPVITNIDEVDGDYPFQGEYYGTIARTGGGPWETIGLQISAQGAGDYIATAYPGGLPGLGYQGERKTLLRGRREPDRLRIFGGDMGFIVADNLAWRIDENQEIHSWLQKVSRISPTMGMAPPLGAVVLFDGKAPESLTNAEVTADRLLKAGAASRDTYQDYFLHVEFQCPYMPCARGQQRANSGVYLQSRYEIQILDSFSLEGFSNECGGIYRFRRPDVNMCLPPLAWQTYDIDFRDARWEVAGSCPGCAPHEARKSEDAMVNVWQNGYPIHEQIAIPHPTGNGKPESPNLLPIVFQQHGSPVRFRNIWLVVNSKDTRHYVPQLPLKVYQHPGDSYGTVWLHLPHGH